MEAQKRMIVATQFNPLYSQIGHFHLLPPRKIMETHIAPCFIRQRNGFHSQRVPCAHIANLINRHF